MKVNKILGFNFYRKKVQMNFFLINFRATLIYLFNLLILWYIKIGFIKLCNCVLIRLSVIPHLSFSYIKSWSTPSPLTRNALCFLVEHFYANVNQD